jgi:hypothetical protein
VAACESRARVGAHPGDAHGHAIALVLRGVVVTVRGEQQWVHGLTASRVSHVSAAARRESARNASHHLVEYHVHGCGRHEDSASVHGVVQAAVQVVGDGCRVPHRAVSEARVRGTDSAQEPQTSRDLYTCQSICQLSWGPPRVLPPGMGSLSLPHSPVEASNTAKAAGYGGGGGGGHLGEPSDTKPKPGPARVYVNRGCVRKGARLPAEGRRSSLECRFHLQWANIASLWRRRRMRWWWWWWWWWWW